MKKILIVNDNFPPYRWGGANTIAYLHAKGLKRRGYEVRVFATTQIKGTEGVGEYEGIPVRTFYTDYHYRWWAYKSLNNRQVTGGFEQALKEFSPDIVHFHNIHNYFSYRTITIAKKTGAKVFLTAHDVMSFAYRKLGYFIDYSSKEIPTSFNYHLPWWVNLRDARLRYNPLRNFIIRRYLKQVDRIFAVSSALKQALADNGIKDNVSVVHNGIDVALFEQSFDHEALRSRLGLGGKKVILFVGRFTPDKGRDVTLRALAKVKEKEPAAQLVVVGFDPKAQPEPRMERLIDELDLSGNITFVPSVPYTEMYKYYRSVDCVISPSVIFDTFILTNIEAMAAHKPTITTCFGGAREVVVDSITGFVVNPLDIENFAQKIITLLQHPHETRAMGEKGFERVKEHFTLARMVKGYETGWTRI